MQLNKEQINEIVDYFETKPVLKAYVFGSTARNEANDLSDIDILVDLDYSKRIGLLFVQMKFDLEKILKKPVDLISSNALSKYIKPIVEKEKKLYMSINQKDKIRLQHIFDAILEIETYNYGIQFEDFSKNSLLINATVRQFEIIGEATNHLSVELKENYANVEWKQIIGLRHILIHEYFNVDIPLIWSVIQYDLPEFKNTMQNILNDL